ncbi:MAG: LD-carboxypeptidase [Bacteroidia bacterium]|nr:LD-carboxypeptidase [Bacteroidia bacterium]NNF30682.1 LD-carboxypeptidase [Flavobacteriaceae bacterium]MBT8277273.1 LD-carboxypeptidase [Bacteroidia bacterium]NNJ80798.1 LD-carboxypeptidase [Flavobacteriaceae bacterium]NNK54873.1 LD-carboxypeptidase [Flavobacteriaceae bacterium]
MVTPPFLKPGDIVGIVSTARKISRDELQPAFQLLSKWGLKFILGNTIGSEQDQFAGDDATRALDLQTMLDNPKISAIWCARGGYGTVRLIDTLDFKYFSSNPKWIIGYSDITVLHSHLNTRGIETLHAQMPLEIDKKSYETAESIRNALFGDKNEVSFDNLTKLGRTGKARGELTGGNLSVLYSICGSRSALKTDGKILFLEDLDEYLYHVDRMLQNLKRNGLFDNLKGLIVGGMTDMNDNTIPFGKTAEEIVADIISEYDFPVCFNFPAGHVHDNRALIFGREAELFVSDNTVDLSFTS